MCLGSYLSVWYCLDESSMIICFVLRKNPPNLYVVMIVVLYITGSLVQHKAMNMAQYAQKELNLADELKLDKEVC